MEAIKKDFGSVEKMEELLSNKTIAVQGSGWGWLGYNKETKHLELAVTFNQDTLEATTGMFSGLHSGLLSIVTATHIFRARTAIRH